MSNRHVRAAWEYHNGTKHSSESIRSNRHYLDWDNQPIPFKIYPTLSPIPLPEHLSSAEMTALNAVSLSETREKSATIPSVQTLAEILYLSAGITKRRTYFGGEILFRAAACTGALYHIDLYLVCGALPGLAPGVYHFGPQDFALRQLRGGDWRNVLLRATGSEPAIAHAPVIIAFASTYWRNAWKYQSRAYRHCYWDSGTIMANLLAASAARDVPARIVLGFVDNTVSKLLGLDPAREGATSLVALGNIAPEATPELSPIEPLVLETALLSKSEVEYPAMRAMHQASSLESENEVIAWRKASATAPGVEYVGPTSEPHLIALRPLSAQEVPSDTLESVVQRRGSTRKFSRESISFEALSTMLDRATRGILNDVFSPSERPAHDLYLIVNAVDDLAPGAYVFRSDRRALELLKEGDFRREAGYLGLGQEIPADCSVNVFFLADLNPVLQRFGNRGYRVAQLEASVMGGKLYLAAYALGLGASGLTFFDDDVTDFFSPDAAGKSVMFLIALGKSVKQSRDRVGS